MIQCHHHRRHCRRLPTEKLEANEQQCNFHAYDADSSTVACGCSNDVSIYISLSLSGC
jgi:hypothetical protein